ncbi:MAG: class I SAM-dependent methyltransferase, partial [Veillonella parvula]|nr:class I SAM-dependent methyltransferase [Veillonella parvula]
MKQESKQKKNVGTSVMGNDIETTQNTMHVLDENKVLKKSYEDVVYISQPFGATSLNTLAARALLFGLNPVSLKKARVLELGCSFGGNIISQALYYPEASFTGIDLSSSQIKMGNELIASMGLSNIHLLEKDILDIDDSFGTFDYIIVHGIWSWVPDVVKDKILSICNKNLSDNGVAYVSYNTYPGWKRLEQYREIMQYAEQKELELPLMERTLYTKNILKLVAETMGLDNRISQKASYKIDNIQNVLSSNDYYVAHEYLEPFNDPAQLANDDYIAKEQYYDYIYDTQFRMSLLTKNKHSKKIVRNERVSIDVLSKLYYCSVVNTGIPSNMTDSIHIAIKEVMDRGDIFTVQDIVDHIHRKLPGYTIEMDRVYSRLLYLIIVDNLDMYAEPYERVAFEDNKVYIPQRFIDFISTIVEKEGSSYIGIGDMYNKVQQDIDNGFLFVIKQMVEP